MANDAAELRKALADLHLSMGLLHSALCYTRKNDALRLAWTELVRSVQRLNAAVPNE
jgi:hypothetical protein